MLDALGLRAATVTRLSPASARFCREHDEVAVRLRELARTVGRGEHCKPLPAQRRRVFLRMLWPGRRR